MQSHWPITLRAFFPLAHFPLLRCAVPRSFRLSIFRDLSLAPICRSSPASVAHPSSSRRPTGDVPLELLMPPPLALLPLFLLPIAQLPFSSGHLCYSCSGVCHGAAPCNCQMGSCEAEYCFAEKRPSEVPGVFRLAKGCVKRPQRTRTGCDFEHFADHLQCICAGEFCNDAVLVRVNTARRNVTCRSCAEARPNCGQTCQGQWCHEKHTATSTSSGCGFGPPSLPYLYQTPELLRHRAKVCLSMSRGTGSPHQFCVCSGHLCNDPESHPVGVPIHRPRSSNPLAAILRALGSVQPPQQQRPVQHREPWHSPVAGPQSAQLFECVSCDLSSEDAALTSNCRQNRCRGQFCVYATQRLGNGGAQQSWGWGASQNGAATSQQTVMHEKQGCINVTDRTFVQLGCSHKWVANEQEEIYCACRGDLCNHDLSTASASSSSPTFANSPSNGPLLFLCYSLILPLYFKSHFLQPASG